MSIMLIVFHAELKRKFWFSDILRKMVPFWGQSGKIAVKGTDILRNVVLTKGKSRKIAENVSQIGYWFQFLKVCQNYLEIGV